MVMGQNTPIFFQDPHHSLQRLQILLFASYVKHALFRAEIPYVRLLSVCFHGSCIRTNLMGI